MTSVFKLLFYVGFSPEPLYFLQNISITNNSTIQSIKKIQTILVKCYSNERLSSYLVNLCAIILLCHTVSKDFQTSTETDYLLKWYP